MPSGPMWMVSSDGFNETWVAMTASLAGPHGTGPPDDAALVCRAARRIRPQPRCFGSQVAPISLLLEEHEGQAIVRVVEHQPEGLQEDLTDVAERVGVGERALRGVRERHARLLEAVAAELEPRELTLRARGRATDAGALSGLDLASVEQVQRVHRRCVEGHGPVRAGVDAKEPAPFALEARLGARQVVL